ncbi:tyrosine-type recombinase/integrase [Fimbriiglobus ruber]|uniref:Tyr recombinase domain-containing protein n=1 Tax=Fimbriiglobus ruber TaxID=1908690 RepID=A0A225E8T1_9BACT|nr:site-specific integrase [Fimbriiglobus ruber]OWK46486.1 hypothetical protein FRUB_00185 [Fimbriiglobus ruber]
MGRQAKFTFPLQDGRQVGASFKVRGGYLRVQFPHPSEAGKYVEASTGIEVPKGWVKSRNPPNDVFTAAAKIILKVYSPTLPAKVRSPSWDKVITELPAAASLRDKSLETYLSIIRIFRTYVSESKGPGDVTVEIAKSFRFQYGKESFKRSKKSTAKTYERSAKTIENAVRRLHGLWNHLKNIGYVESNPWDSVPRPTVPKKLVRIPTEDTFDAFTCWLKERYPSWELPSLFVLVKAMAGCRSMDLCSVKSHQLRDGILCIEPGQDKTHRQRIIPLPPDVFRKLDALKGPTYLWESYIEDAKKYRPGSRNRSDFQPRTLFWAINNIFREWNEAHPDRKLKPHDLRKRAITLTTLATQSVDQTAEAIGIDPATARRYYVDAKTAFDGQELLKRMATILRPQRDTAPELGQSDTPK